MNQSSILIVSDDPEFARTVAAKWRESRRVPEITLATSDVWHPSVADDYAVMIVGPVRSGRVEKILSTLNGATGSAAIAVIDDERTCALLSTEHPHLIVIPQLDGWLPSLISIATESMKRVEAIGRAQRAERLALEAQNYASLGRYMLEVRPSVNNALTSVLGNADLLLFDPSLVRETAREQIRTIHSMALRLNEIMQRFSSLANEIRMNEKESHPETSHFVEGLAGQR